jgi:AsmA protein
VKLLLKSLAVLIGLVLLALILLVLLFDPNMFKPRIEALAREQGVALNINGDLSWTLWPSLGIDVSDVRVAALSAPDKPIAQLADASLLLAIKPLFSGEVVVHHVLVDGAVIDLSVDEQGTGNWEALTADDSDATTAPATPPTTDDTTTTEESAQQMQLAVEKISLSNSALTYNDAQGGQEIAVQDIALTVEQFNLQGNPFAMQLSLITRISNAEQPSQTLSVETRLQHQVQLAEDFSTLALRDGQLTLQVQGSQTAELHANYQVSTSNLQDAARFEGELTIPSFNARTLLAALGTELETAEQTALTDVSLDTRFTGSQTAIAFDPLTIKLDRTTINGTMAMTDFTTSAIKVVLNGDQINIDHYLAPDSETETPATASSASGDEELIPLETVKSLNADISADFAQVTIADMPLKNISLRTTARDGVVNLNKAQATAYDGVISATGKLDGRGDTAVINVDGKVDSFQLEPFLSDMELNEKVNFTGAINATTTGTARGVTMNQLLDSLVNETHITGAQVKFFPLNIEQKFCQLVNLVNRVDDPQKAWEDFTEMEDLSGKITMANRVVTVESFTAGIEQLMVGTNGSLDLNNDRYDFRLPLKLIPTPTTTETTTDGTTVAATSAEGCIIGSNYWLNRSLSLLRCHGSLTDLNPVRDCRPDSKALASLTKDFAEYKLREKHGDKIDAAEQKVDAKKDELRKKLDEKLGGEGAGKKAEDLLKNIFKKKQDEQ